MKRLLIALLLFCGHAWGQTSPNWSTGYVPPASEWNSLWGGKQDVTGAISVTAKGAKCDGVTNDSPAFTAAIAAASALSAGGHVVTVPATGHSCYLATGVVLGSASQSGVSLIGTAGAYWPGYDDNTEADWTTFGSWIKCGDLTNACITVGGNGSTVSGLNFWYAQPTPPGSNCGATCTFTHDWNPTAYPFTISIPSPQNFNHFSNINIINATNCIDLEGPSTGVGSFFTYFDHMQLGCFNTGMKFGKVDNAISVNDVKFLVLWYQAFNDVWGYMEGDSTVTGHKVDIDAAYLSDPSFNAVQFYQSWAAMRFTNASVGSGLGTVTFAGQGLQFTNTVFNQVCQAIILGGSNAILNGDFTNTTINIDPQTSVVAGQCGAHWPIAFNLNSDDVDLSFTNINGFEAQQLFNIGGGTSGGVHLSGRVRISYGSFVSDTISAINVNSGGFVDMANGVNNLFPVTGAGPQCSGACRTWPVVPAGDIWLTGFPGQPRQLNFLTTNASGAFLARWGVLEDNTAESGGDAGSDFQIYRYNDAGGFWDAPLSIVRATGAVVLHDLPTTCSGMGTGTLWNSSGTVHVC